MVKELKNPKVICSIVGILLAVALIVLQFVPYWSFTQMITVGADYGKEVQKTISIAEYSWFPTHNDGLLDVFNEGIGSLDAEFVEVNNVAEPMVVQLLFAIALIALCIWRPKLPVIGLAAIVCGGAGLLAMLGAIPAFSLNSTLWIVNIVLSSLMLIVGILKFFSKSIFKNAQ